MPRDVKEAGAVTELEFLPEDYLKARFQRRVGFIRSWLLLAMGLAMVLWSFQIGAWVRDARAELQALRGTGSAVESDVERVEGLRMEAQAYGRRVALIEQLEPGVLLTEAMAVATNLLPDSIVLEEMGVTGADKQRGTKALVHLAGVAPAEEIVSRLLGRMEASKRFTKATLVECRGQNGGAVPGRWFVIEAEVVEPAGREIGRT